MQCQGEEELLARFRVADTVEWVCGRGYRVVTLQFPDELLPAAAPVARAVTAGCRRREHDVQAYILADTTYNSLSVDEVAAAHVGAECVVHYGRASLTKLSRLPAFFVFPEAPLDVAAAAAAVAGCTTAGEAAGPVLLFVDQPHLHLQPQLEAAVRQAAPGVRWVFARVPTRELEPEAPGGSGAVVAAAKASGAPAPTRSGCCQGDMVACRNGIEQRQQQGAAPCCGGGTCQPASPQLPTSTRGNLAGGQKPAGSGGSAAGYCWALPPGAAPADCAFAWVGSAAAPALLQLQLSHSGQPWVVYDTDAGVAGAAGSASGGAGGGALAEGVPLAISRTLRRRYYLVEKARDARIIGILVGTLGVAGYGDAIDRLRAAARAAGKKTYTLLLGKPSPAKLANFPEVEVFVMVADPQGQVLDSKEYLAPIITPHEAMLAFSPESQWDEAAYRLDFEGVLQARAAWGPASARGHGRRGWTRRPAPGLLAAPRAGAARGDGRGRGGRVAALKQSPLSWRPTRCLVLPSPSTAQGTAPAAAAGSPSEPRFSLISGSYQDTPSHGDEEGDEGGGRGGASAAAPADPGTALALQAAAALHITPAPAGRSDLVEARSAADYLVHKRSWTGVEGPLVGSVAKPVERAAEGMRGRAAGYAGEPPAAAAAEAPAGAAAWREQGEGGG
eukprot:scaffold13.g266.t1